MLKEPDRFSLDLTRLSPKEQLKIKGVESTIQLADAYRTYMNGAKDFPISEKVETPCQYIAESIDEHIDPRVSFGPPREQPAYIAANTQISVLVSELLRYIKCDLSSKETRLILLPMRLPIIPCYLPCL